MRNVRRNPINFLKPIRVGGYKWRKFREEIIFERGYKCEKCGKETKEIIADHKRPIFLLGKEFDKSNIQLLCKECSDKKNKYDLSISSWMNLL